MQQVYDPVKKAASTNHTGGDGGWQDVQRKEKDLTKIGIITCKILELEFAHVLSADKGEFIPQHNDDDWSIPMREKLKRKLLGVVFRRGHGLETNEKWSAAVAWYERALAIDPLVEECYQRLMICHRHLGHKAEIMTAYNRCCKMLDSMIGIALSDKTKKYSAIRLNDQFLPHIATSEYNLFAIYIFLKKY
jgi:two-component SAPR family response regulator